MPKPCPHYDCGWCYHEEGPEDGCHGTEDCPIYEDAKMEDYLLGYLLDNKDKDKHN